MMPVEVPMLLVDGHNLLWRAAFGFPATITSRDKTRDITAEFGFFALLRVAIREELLEAPEVIVVFDGEHGSTTRQDVESGYKANRLLDGNAQKALAAIPNVQRGLDAYGIRWVEIDTAEADDVIATLARAESDRMTWILSTDRDYYQLLSDRVWVLNTAMRPGNRHVGPNRVLERFGVHPYQWPCFCALKGDPSDNIPGVRGVGHATATRLLEGGLTLDELADSGRLKAAKGRSVSQAWDQVLAWRNLIRMRTDLTVPTTPQGIASAALPRPAEMIEELELW